MLCITVPTYTVYLSFLTLPPPLSSLFCRWTSRRHVVQPPSWCEGQGYPQHSRRDVQPLHAQSKEGGWVGSRHPVLLPICPWRRQRGMCSTALQARERPSGTWHTDCCGCCLWHGVCSHGGCSDLWLCLRLTDGTVPEGDEEPRSAADGRVRSRDRPRGRTTDIPDVPDLTGAVTTQRGLWCRAWLSHQ